MGTQSHLNIKLMVQLNQSKQIGKVNPFQKILAELDKHHALIYPHTHHQNESDEKKQKQIV